VHTDQFTNGSQIKIRSCISQLDNNLGWKPIYAGTNLDNRECYRFENYGAQGKVFGASGGNTAPGTPVILWSNFNNQYTHPDQLWCVYPT
jgi:hypothetical protein